MEIVTTIAQVRKRVGTVRRDGKMVGLVPTMGYLHEGHAALMRAARESCEYVVVSIFVNPLQFGPGEDFERYPRDPARDTAICEQEGVDLLFMPSTDELYPSRPLTRVRVEELSAVLCGASRPGHFEGVGTVVSKLFNIVLPDRAFFGQKDAQQVTIIERMVADLNFPVEVVRVSTIREPDGLAVSSRNVYLSAAERAAATVLRRALTEVKSRVEEGARDVAELEAVLHDVIRGEPLARIDYARIVDRDTLEPIESIERPALAAVAAYFRKTRLIDNTLLDPRGDTWSSIPMK